MIFLVFLSSQLKAVFSNETVFFALNLIHGCDLFTFDACLFIVLEKIGMGAGCETMFYFLFSFP